MIRPRSGSSWLRPRRSQDFTRNVRFLPGCRFSWTRLGWSLSCWRSAMTWPRAVPVRRPNACAEHSSDTKLTWARFLPHRWVDSSAPSARKRIMSGSPRTCCGSWPSLASRPSPTGCSAAVLTEAADRNQGLAAALATWDEGCCPACGSWPALAEVISGNRHLRCSFCGAGWQPVTYRCIYCGEAGESFLTAAADMKQVWRRLELCRTCGGYLKSVAVEDPAPFELLPVEDLSSSDLDVGAVSRGYTRPPMREFSAV